MGQTIVGGIIGALVGLAANIGLELVTGSEMTWFPVVVGLLTGLGVRQLNSAAAMHHASYLRGAIAGLIALAAIAGAPAVKGMVMKRGLDSDVAKPELKESDEAADEETADEGADDAEVEEQEVPDRTPRTGGRPEAAKGPLVPGEPDVWQAVFMALGTFVAYEFARGSGGAPASAPAGEGEAPSEPAPAPQSESAPEQPPEEGEAK